MGEVLYVYAIGRDGHQLPQGIEAVDGSDRLSAVGSDGLTAFVTPVDDVDFSQGVIDARAKDVEWLGALGYRHQNVMVALMRGGTIIPLRAFTLFHYRMHALFGSLPDRCDHTRREFGSGRSQCLRGMRSVRLGMPDGRRSLCAAELRRPDAAAAHAASDLPQGWWDQREGIVS